jgi:FAD/FMN-containing dehydrogenase
MAVATRATLDPAAVAGLETSLRGALIRPEDPTYDDHRRIWNGSIDRRPALIARCTGVADVIAAVTFAQRTGTPVAVRSGGHSFPGLSIADDALVIDLAQMKGIRVDPQTRTARVQAGVLLGELDRETQQFGLAVPAGIVTHTGVAGLTLGGGIGWLQRKYGLTVDQLVSVDVVTADGELVKASADENADLFWGIRGAGANFGIVTDFEFRLNSLGPIVVAGPIAWPMEESPEVLRFYRDWIADAPDELMTILIHRKAPSLDFVPAEHHGKPIVMVIPCYAGPVEEGEAVVRPMKEFSSPIFDLCVPKPFVVHQAMFDPTFPHYRWYYFKPCGLPALTDEIIDITVEHSLRISSPLTSFPIWQLGGAISHRAEDETAYGGRDVAFMYNIGACTATEDGFADERDWVREFYAALAPHQTGAYVNFLDAAGEVGVVSSYGREKYARLQQLKRRYDPRNVFRFNQNIPPA